ncbi:COX4 subunit IV of cytochrome c oxidase [Agaricus bisporus var. bisporus H97]|uniref:COX4 subunit IV of cytochrome c oxidase n=1 Tax=Agaricus bisporus var. bisporus (strain H97 / ATCC MYA-4626 / FGSC 10389) TaxID=936046 RepID=UPI00029F775E|nr:COX4 subunit IV of cytochrome c oxidase [Agaricus bisporus var. bisporus H97]EKV42713.1 COX4 subunit IV of cytochrome c oxidase [Agaricus bisporus var. bisporus H97]
MYLAAAVRLARQRAPASLHRSIATTVSAPTTYSSSSSPSVSPVPISNVEASWTKLSPEERASVHQQLETIQQKDWKELSVDEKKAAYYVAFGPHGPRAPIDTAADRFKIYLYTTGLIALTGVVYYGIHLMAPPAPRTLTKEWEEATNERAKEMKLNPITGISSEGYKGKGFVQSK